MRIQFRIHTECHKCFVLTVRDVFALKITHITANLCVYVIEGNISQLSVQDLFQVVQKITGTQKKFNLKHKIVISWIFFIASNITNRADFQFIYVTIGLKKKRYGLVVICTLGSAFVCVETRKWINLTCDLWHFPNTNNFFFSRSLLRSIFSLQYIRRQKIFSFSNFY